LPQLVPMPDAEVLYYEAISVPAEPAIILDRLIEDIPWRQDHIVLWGKPLLQPRLSAWFGDPGSVYTYSGLTLTPLPWTKLLAELKQTVETLAGERFNSVLLNYYRNERDSMGMHSDDERELGRNPTIASLSFGAERELTFRHRRRKELAPVRLRLASGSLLIMRGATQHHWKHGIAKERRPCGPRVNLTFRRIFAV